MKLHKVNDLHHLTYSLVHYQNSIDKTRNVLPSFLISYSLLLMRQDCLHISHYRKRVGTKEIESSTSR